MIRRERFLVYFLFVFVILWLIYGYKQIENSRGVIFKQEGENFSVQIFSEEGRNIMVKEFNPTYDIYGQEENEIIKTANETVNQLCKVIIVRLGNGEVCCNAEKKVILNNFTREEVIKKMVEFVAENQKNLGYNFTTGYEPREVCEMVTNNYNTGL